MGKGKVGILRNPRFSREYGSEYCGNTAGMDLAIAGLLRGWIFYGDPAGMVVKFGCEKFWSAYSI